MVDFYESATTPACHQALDYLCHQSFVEHFYLVERVGRLKRASRRWGRKQRLIKDLIPKNV